MVVCFGLPVPARRRVVRPGGNEVWAAHRSQYEHRAVHASLPALLQIMTAMRVETRPPTRDHEVLVHIESIQMAQNPVINIRWVPDSDATITVSQ
jgi:hypothetical protein